MAQENKKQFLAEDQLEILTVDEVAALLRISKWHVYELTKARTRAGEMRDNPLPAVRFGSSVRFRKSDVEAWIEKLVAKKRS